MKWLTDFIFAPLTFIGALNWGLVGFFGLDVVSYFFGVGSLLSQIIYVIIGVCAILWLIVIATEPSCSNK